MNNKTIKGYLFAIFSAVIYGCMPLMAKHIYADGVNPFTLVLLRNFLALPSLAVLALYKHKTLKIPVKALPKIAVISFFGCSITPVLLFSSYNYMATGTATVFHFIYPAVVVLIGIIFLHKKVPLLTLISVFMCFAGICLFYNSTETLHPQGSILALLSGITFALYVVLLSGYHNEVSGFLFSFYVAAASSVTMFLLCLGAGELSFPETLSGWILCAVFAFAVTTLAVVFFQQGAFLIGGEKTSVLSALEPITGIIIGAAVFSEPVQPRILIGSALVVAASILIAVPDLKKSSDRRHT